MKDACRGSLRDATPDDFGVIRSDFCDLAGDAFIAVVQQIRAQSAHLAVYIEVRVGLIARPASLPAHPKAAHTVRIPITMANPAAAIKGAAREFISDWRENIFIGADTLQAEGLRRLVRRL